jgi:hypothetical protein
VNVQAPLEAQPLPNAIKNLHIVPDSVGRLAFGNLRALDLTVHPSGHLPMIPTRTGTLPAAHSTHRDQSVHAIVITGTTAS